MKVLNGGDPGMDHDYARRDEVHDLAKSIHELSLNIEKNRHDTALHFEISSRVQQQTVEELKKLSAVVSDLSERQIKRDTIWSMIKAMWSKAPGVCIIALIVIALMTDGSLHISEIITNFYKIKNGNV